MKTTGENSRHPTPSQPQPSLWRRHFLFPAILLACLAALLATRAADSSPKTQPMVLTIRTFELRPKVKAEDFEAFARKELAQAPVRKLGPRMQVLKGDRGERKGKYVLVWQFDSVAARDQCFPKEGWGSSSAFDDEWGRLKAMLSKFGDFVKETGDYTDYVVVAE